VNAATTQGPFRRERSDGTEVTKDTVECDCDRFPVQNSFSEMSVRFVPYFSYLMEADAIGNTVNVSR